MTVIDSNLANRLRQETSERSAASLINEVLHDLVETPKIIERMAEIKSLYSSYDDIYEDDNITALVTFDELAYVGYDPEATKKALAAGGFTVSDILTIIRLCLMRGTNIGEKFNNKSTQPLKNAIQTLKNKGLKTGTPAANNDLTIGRVLSTFADKAAKELVVNSDYYRIISKDVGNIPHYLKFASGASLCIDRDQLREWKEWAKSFDKVINSKSNKVNPDNVDIFGDIMFSSQYYSIERRNKIQTELNALMSSKENVV